MTNRTIQLYANILHTIVISMVGVIASKVTGLAGGALEDFALDPAAAELLCDFVNLLLLTNNRRSELTSHLSDRGTQLGTAPAGNGGGPLGCCCCCCWGT